LDYEYFCGNSIPCLVFSLALPIGWKCCAYDFRQSLTLFLIKYASCEKEKKKIGNYGMIVPRIFLLFILDIMGDLSLEFGCLKQFFF
jgi:hypothetical protein